MGQFVPHIASGFVFTLLGLWHTVNTIKAYNLGCGSNFKVKFWYPLDRPHSNLKYLELILVFSFSVLGIFGQFWDYPFVHLSFNVINFEHATMFLHLAVFSGFALYNELNRSSNLLSGVEGVFAACVFSQELFLLHFHSADHNGIEGHYHWLLQLIVFASLGSVIVAACCPTCFPAALVLSLLVVLQGCWFMNMGFMLWVSNLVPKGCSMRIVENGKDEMMLGAVICDSKEADMRARALANLQFSWILAGILIFTGFISLKCTKSETCTPKIQLSDYEQL
ncbi:transmembrane protein 45B-like [Cucurbita maxima]|uniref:Transmembrane protein 45B-like n=1 Tax=Cucurbita maxima TaxID=3661 RepID=A0A6J1IBA1_CUCMA|nr:transmembrane protein 45B-like [Cucurbita maxima]